MYLQVNTFQVAITMYLQVFSSCYYHVFTSCCLHVQWTPLNVITFVNTKNDNNNRLITLTEKLKIAILSFIRCRKNKIE